MTIQSLSHLAFQLQRFFWSAWFLSWLGWIKKKKGGISISFKFLVFFFISVLCHRFFFWASASRHCSHPGTQLSNLTDKRDLLIHTGLRKRASATQECYQIDSLPGLGTRITCSSCLLSVKAWFPPPPQFKATPLKSFVCEWSGCVNTCWWLIGGGVAQRTMWQSLCLNKQARAVSMHDADTLEKHKVNTESTT